MQPDVHLQATSEQGARCSWEARAAVDATAQSQSQSQSQSFHSLGAFSLQMQPHLTLGSGEHLLLDGREEESADYGVGCGERVASLDVFASLPCDPTARIGLAPTSTQQQPQQQQQQEQPQQ